MAGKKRKQYRPQPSNIDNLPEDLRLDLLELIRDRSNTQTDILDEINGKLKKRGLQPLSKSSLSRHILKTHRAAERIHLAQKAADIIADKLDQRTKKSDIGRVLIETAKSMAYIVSESMLDDEGFFDDKASLKDINILAQSLERLERAEKSSIERLEKEETIRNKLIKEQDKKLNKAVADGRIDPAVMEAARREMGW